MAEWQPIETAPTHRVWVCGRYDNEPRDWWYAWAFGPDWLSMCPGMPSHWSHPEPPAEPDA